MEKQYYINYYIYIFIIIGFLHLSYGCSIEGVDNWLVPQTKGILDTYKGVLFSGATQNIQEIISVVQREGLNKGPYVDVRLDNSLFTISTNAAFEKYENFETQTNLGYTISLRCTDSSVRVLVFIINITDTNNNDPIFLPTSYYQFTIAPPVPPGFLVTTCFNDIVVKDIDLTTQRIDFKIEGSDLFKISYDPSSEVPKEFKARLETTDLIRSIAEPIILKVFATDVDLTEGPPRTTTATVVISADSQFEFPDEPIFSQPFYLADYKSNEVILQHTISLRQGYDDQVKFSFESEHSEYFELVPNQNNLSFKMRAPIPFDLYNERQIYLVVKATREHTSGTTATVILKLPEDTHLKFENAIYEGTIIDNVLQLTDLKLKQGYEGFNVTVDIKSEYTFTANIEENVIRISMDPLPTDVIKKNYFINLQVIASNNRSTAVTIVTLEIIKDDHTTPAFESNFYNGSYSTDKGLTLEQLILSQGYDETVKIALEGKHFEFFQFKQDGPRITLTSSTIPSEIFYERNIMITVLASKPRTVGAHTAVNIVLPSARYLHFEKDIYTGFIENNNLTLNTVVLEDGYDSYVNFTLTGELMSYFSLKNDQNVVTIVVEKDIPETVLLENNFLVLTLRASGANAVPTSTTIVLQVIKEDYRTPVFSDNLYSLKYENNELSSENISLVQGFDETVTFYLTGEHREYFEIEPSLNFVKLVLKSPIPEDLIFSEKIIILNIEARKPRTVDANAAVYITFPLEMIEPIVMSFSQNVYQGFLEGGNLTVDDMVLQTSYNTEIKYVLSGEYSENFLITNSSNVIKVTPANDWSLEDLGENKIILLEVEAKRKRAISAKTVILIDILKSVIVPPVFEKAVYSGSYTSAKELLFEDIISLQKGFDNNVEFSLEEEFSKWFTLEQKNNAVTLKVNATTPIPEEILENNQHLFFTIIARKPGTITGRAAIYINLPKEDTRPTILQFEKRQYTGIIENGTLQLENIRLMYINISLIHFNLTGDLSNYFTISNLSDAITIEHVEMPKEVIENNTFIILNIEASEVSVISGHATIVLEIIRNEEQNVVPIFEESFYTGQYSNSTGLVFLSNIKLVQGFDETVTFALIDENAKWFSLIHNGPNDLSLRLKEVSLNEITDKSHLVFTVVANKTNSPSARAAIIISLIDNNDLRVLKFEQKSYVGYIEDQILHLENLRLLEENILSIEFNITGDYSSYFSISKYYDFVQINLMDPPTDMIEANDVIILNLEGSQTGAISGHTTIVIKIVKYEGLNITKPVFSEIYYKGEYTQESDLIFSTSITLTQGYDETVKFELEDDDSKWFSLTQDVPNNLGLKIKNESINEIAGRGHLIFTIVANKFNSTSARAAIVISLLESNVRILQFEQISYLGSLVNGQLEIEEIRLLNGISTSMEFNITGDYAAYFSISKLVNSIKINLIESPDIELPDNDKFMILNIKAFEPGAVNGYTTIVINIVKDQENNTVTPVFSEAFYSGRYSEENGLIFLSVITLVEGYDETVMFVLDNDDSKGFALIKNGLNNFSIILNGSLNEPEHKKYLLFTVIAQKPNTQNGQAAIVISIAGPSEIDNVSFDRTLYNGKLHNRVLSHDEITLTGFNENNIIIRGEYSDLFKSELTNGVVKIETSGEEFPRNLTYIALELQAASANAVLLIDVSFPGPPEIDNVSFDRTLYNGKLHNEVLLHDEIILRGFNDSNIKIKGEYNDLFKSEYTNGFVKIETSGEEFPRNINYIVLELQAATANAVLLIDVSFSEPPEIDNVSFDRTLYSGKLHNAVLSHDEITLTGFKDNNIIITGEYSDLFKSELTNGVVKIETSGEEFPRNLTYIALELQAASANAVLLIDVNFSENPQQPIVSFKSQSYFLWADENQTGVVGTVEATADNGEAIIYSLSDINEHIQSRININKNGEILLTAAFDKGVYTFNAVATSVQSQVKATAPVRLRVENLPDCSDKVGLSPLIVLKRLEEEPHLNLVVLNETEHKGCRYTLSNIFPKDQSWLYVDNLGLHTKAIDREDRSIAYMTLSQIQVELTLDCDSDEMPAFNKRSLRTEDRTEVYSYDEGPNKWVLTDTILFNAKRSFVNLIVEDINDNSPIFLGKGNEPIYVGYPVSELENTVLPRALAELKARDADIGENAAIIYWSAEDNLAVSPNTGLVHVRNNVELENNSRLTIYAIDQNGKGRNGTIDIVVKLLNKNQIAVLTVRNAFLEDEVSLLNELSVAVGYEIKVLKAVVISNNNEDGQRRKRDITSYSRASLQLYVYGLLESEPVDINQLTRDINNNTTATINIAGIVSLEDHLEDLKIRSTGLLASTISLAVLLFIVLVSLAVWFVLKWRRIKNYERFSNHSNSTSQLSSANLPKIDVVTRSRSDIEEIKRTERRLQELLETPVVSPLDFQASDDVKSPIKPLDDAIINISSSDAQSPIVIQSIDKLKDNTEESDDNDEFGEITKPRKSVVTFNENVEKIIHIEDVPDDESSENNFEIYKF